MPYNGGMINPKAIADTTIPIHDLVHGELKNLLLETEEALETATFEDRVFLEGKMDAYVNVYSLIYKLIFAREDLDKQ